MNQTEKERSGLPLPLRIALALAVLAIGWLLLSRGRESAPLQQTSPVPAQSEAPAELELPQTMATTPVNEASPVCEPTPEQPQEQKNTEKYVPIVYDSKSYQLVTDMVYAYKIQVPDRDAVIAADVAELKAYEPRLGTAWGGIMEYWDYANARMELNYDRLPEDLPQDDSLCIVVLGFQLLTDGSMSPEMHGRCELALQAAEQYPNAFVAVTGGGTAYKNPKATEAGVMANWFLLHGIPEERLIIEDQSFTTEQNALFTREILTERYPQVKSLVIVSSDYHLPLGCLMFTEAALLYQCEYGTLPFAVVSNLALRGYGLDEYKNPQEQALYVWSVADPSY